jgi:hypothetical protein
MDNYLWTECQQKSKASLHIHSLHTHFPAPATHNNMDIEARSLPSPPVFYVLDDDLDYDATQNETYRELSELYAERTLVGYEHEGWSAEDGFTSEQREEYRKTVASNIYVVMAFRPSCDALAHLIDFESLPEPVVYLYAPEYHESLELRYEWVPVPYASYFRARFRSWKARPGFIDLLHKNILMSVDFTRLNPPAAYAHIKPAFCYRARPE